MDGNIRLSATVISCVGNDTDRDDFYFNGNFANCHNTQSIQCSFEKASNNFIFAVSDSMGFDDGTSDNISAIKEIKKYHESAKKQQFGLETITEKIYEAVQLSSNLIYSKSIISSHDSALLTGFSSLIVDGNRAVTMNLGNNGAFLYRQGEQIEIFDRIGRKKDEKLRKLGITPNSPEIYNDTEKILKLAEEESKTKIKISQSFEIEEGDLIILCSDGLLNEVSKNRIHAVVDSGLDPSKIASVLFQEASKSGAGDGITVTVVRVEEIRNAAYLHNKSHLYEDDDFENEQIEKHSNTGHSVVNYILAFVCVLVISGILFMGYLIIKNGGTMLSNNKDVAQSTQTNTATDTLAGSSPSTALDTSTGDSSAVVSQSGSSQQQSENSTQKPAPDQQGSSQNADGNYDTYIVQSGDTLSSISTKYYGSPNKYDAIMKLNNLQNENSLVVGQELKIPKANQ